MVVTRSRQFTDSHHVPTMTLGVSPFGQAGLTFFCSPEGGPFRHTYQK